MALYGIYELSKLLTQPVRLETTLARVLDLLSSFLDMRHGLIALLADDGTPRVVVGSGWSEATAKRYFERLPERAIGRIVVTAMPLLVESIAEDPLFADWEVAERPAPGAGVAFIGVPIKDDGRVVGTLTIDRPVEHDEESYVRFDEDVRFLTMVANLVGQTVRLQRLVTQDRERLMEERHRLEKSIARSAAPNEPAPSSGIVGQSPALRAVLEKVRIVARSHSTVLLRGESGTGKELFARSLHDLSPRASRAFVSLNCAALPETVLESELFGHERGAFTGATSMRKGRFELADGGTLFLDEVGEISASFQAKLLRVLQEGEFERVGGSTTIKVDVRLIAATNRNLEEAVARHEFRADLYYRIHVVPILLPPLRDRPGDIPLLAREFLRRFNAEHGTERVLSDEALAVLSGCCFPGNVRELENCVRRTATLAGAERIVPDDFACRHGECLSSVLWNRESTFHQPGHVPLAIARGDVRRGADTGRRSVPAPAAPSHHDDEDEGCPLPGACPVLSQGVDTERDRLVEAMESAGWVQAKAARMLGLTPRQVGYALRKHDIPIKKF